MKGQKSFIYLHVIEIPAYLFMNISKQYMNYISSVTQLWFIL